MGSAPGSQSKGKRTPSAAGPAAATNKRRPIEWPPSMVPVKPAALSPHDPGRVQGICGNHHGRDILGNDLVDDGFDLETGRVHDVAEPGDGLKLFQGEFQLGEKPPGIVVLRRDKCIAVPSGSAHEHTGKDRCLKVVARLHREHPGDVGHVGGSGRCSSGRPAAAAP